MGIFSGISEAFHSVADSITNAYDSFTEKVHDIFYTPDEYISGDITVKPTKDAQYEEWIVEQSLVQMNSWSFLHDIFDDKTGTP